MYLYMCVFSRPESGVQKTMYEKKPKERREREQRPKRGALFSNWLILLLIALSSALFLSLSLSLFLSPFIPYIHTYIYNCVSLSIYLSLSLHVKNTLVVVVVVAGTIAPSRDLPELSAEDTIRIILSNLNLVVPVVAALLVIIIAIIVICILRSKGNHHKGIYKYIQLITNFVFFFGSSLSLSLCQPLRHLTHETNNEHSRLFTVSLFRHAHTHTKYRISFCLANCPLCCCCIR